MVIIMENISWYALKGGKQKSSKIYHSEGIFSFAVIQVIKWSQFFYCNNNITRKILDYMTFSTKFYINSEFL